MTDEDYRPISKGVYFGEVQGRTDVYHIIPCGNRKRMLSIGKDSFTLLNLVLLHVVENYDNYSDYILQYEKWKDILQLTEEILQIDEIDEVINHLHIRLQRSGAPYLTMGMQPIVEQMIRDVFGRKMFYLELIAELKRFSVSCIKEDASVQILGL